MFTSFLSYSSLIPFISLSLSLYFSAIKNKITVCLLANAYIHLRGYAQNIYFMEHLKDWP
jgi:hypothetical protein